ncbi:MAG TPA: hypothetical protein VFL89_02930, partial [Solirubrobacterales bacterium]|nr:hypothetical protein [Solirubrobacterales bacterium]
VAIVGDPLSLAEALSVSDQAYLFAVFASLVAGAVTLALRPVPGPASAAEGDGTLPYALATPDAGDA